MKAPRRLYELLETSHPKDWPSLAIDWGLIVLIVANVVAVTLETVPSLAQRYGPAFRVFDTVSVAIFTVEYALRVWVCVEHLPLARLSPLKARLRFAASPYAIIDLLAILPFYIALFFPFLDLRMLRIFRLLRLFKLARYSPALATLGRVLADERRALVAALLIMVGLLTLAATAMYNVERHVQPDVFGSIPQAMWWAAATLTTVGYGDAIPITGLGRVLGVVVMVFGLGMFALPIGIIASGFASEIHRRDFVVTWGMVARVPLFAKLDALSVSRITNLLRARVVPPDTVVFRKGDEADCMYFIASGQVEADLAPHAIRLEDGEFFGEAALLRHSRRSATVRTITRARLLALDAEDFNELLEADADLREAITRVAETRVAADKEASEPA